MKASNIHALTVGICEEFGSSTGRSKYLCIDGSVNQSVDKANNILVKGALSIKSSSDQRFVFLSRQIAKSIKRRASVSIGTV